MNRNNIRSLLFCIIGIVCFIFAASVPDDSTPLKDYGIAIFTLSDMFEGEMVISGLILLVIGLTTFKPTEKMKQWYVDKLKDL